MAIRIQEWNLHRFCLCVHVWDLFKGRQFVARKLAFHGDDTTTGPEQVMTEIMNVGQVAERAGDKGIKFVIRPEMFHPAVHRDRIVNLTFPYRGIDKAGLFSPAVEQGELLPRAGDRQRQSWEAGTCADVDNPFTDDPRCNGETVEHMEHQHLPRIRDGGEVETPVPLFEQRYMLQTPVLLRR